MKILYLDDDPEEFEVLERTLEHARSAHIGPGTRVIGITSIEEIDSALSSEKPDLLLVDYFLNADTTSERFIRRILGNSTSPPVVLVTGHTSLKLGEELLSAVADSELFICHKRDMDPDGLSHLVDDVMGQKYRVLVVDDEETDFEMVSMHLSFYSQRRFECVWANSSSDARRILREDDTGFDAFIIDYQMPMETGTALVMELVGKEYTQPIVICSGYSTLEMDTDLMRLISSRQVKFISKNNLGTGNLIKRLQPIHRQPN